MSQTETEVIERLYTGLDNGDGEAIASCYTPDAHFRDPAFGDLHGPEVGGMWKMLCDAGGDLDIELREHQADGTRGSAHWIATYVFTQTGRPVVNDIRASYTFRDGLIADHVDEFDMTKWARQALGPMGLLPPVRALMRRKARQRLDAFMAGKA